VKSPNLIDGRLGTEERRYDLRENLVHLIPHTLGDVLGLGALDRVEEFPCHDVIAVHGIGVKRSAVLLPSGFLVDQESRAPLFQVERGRSLLGQRVMRRRHERSTGDLRRLQGMEHPGHSVSQSVGAVGAGALWEPAENKSGAEGGNLFSD